MKTNLITFRPVGHAEWESEDWHWHIASRAANYPDDGTRTFSVRDLTTGDWVEEDFATYEAAVAHCEEAHRAELREIGLEP